MCPQIPSPAVPGWGGGARDFLSRGPGSTSCLSFQAILEENKEKLPLAIDPVVHPGDHIFKCVPSASSQTSWVPLPLWSHGPHNSTRSVLGHRGD